MPWTEDRIEQLQALWAGGDSAAVIARRFGDVSRCAVLSKVYRLGLPSRDTLLQMRHGQPVVRNAPKPVTRPRKSRRAYVRRRFASLLLRLSMPVISEPCPREEAPEGPVVSFAALGPGMCRWPFGDPQHAGFGFCGAPQAPGKAYCPRHAHEALRSAKRRQT